MITRRLIVLMIWFSSIITPMANASKKVDMSPYVVGDYEVHFSAFNTTFIKPKTAAALGISRGKGKALVNISVVDVSDPEQPVPIQVQQITGEFYDLIYRKPLEFRSVKEQQGQYYLAPFAISTDNEYIQFDIAVKTTAEQQLIEFSFSSKFYQD